MKPTIATIILAVAGAPGFALAPVGPANVLGPGPWTYNTAERNTRVTLSVVARGLSHPWGLVFLPNGAGMLVTERGSAQYPGRVRIVRGGVLAEERDSDQS